MSTQVDFMTATAFARLNLQEGDSVVGHLRALRQDALERMASASDDKQWLRAQGRAQLLKELLDLIANGNQIAEKLNATR